MSIIIAQRIGFDHQKLFEYLAQLSRGEPLDKAIELARSKMTPDDLTACIKTKTGPSSGNQAQIMKTVGIPQIITDLLDRVVIQDQMRQARDVEYNSERAWVLSSNNIDVPTAEHTNLKFDLVGRRLAYQLHSERIHLTTGRLRVGDFKGSEHTSVEITGYRGKDVPQFLAKSFFAQHVSDYGNGVPLPFLISGDLNGEPCFVQVDCDLPVKGTPRLINEEIVTPQGITNLKLEKQYGFVANDKSFTVGSIDRSDIRATVTNFGTELNLTMPEGEGISKFQAGLRPLQTKNVTALEIPGKKHGEDVVLRLIIHY